MLSGLLTYRRSAVVRASAVLIACLHAPPADAGVVIAGTRIVYPSDKREVTINVNNAGRAPALVQVWLDTGKRATTANEAAPFIATPPMFRLDPQKGQSIRLMFKGSPLPTDRETLFWFNLLDIPPRVKTDLAPSNFLQLAVRQRIKLFFRPTGLDDDPNEAGRAIRWDIACSEGACHVTAHNASPYHVSLISIDILADKATLKLEADMVAPFGEASFPLPSNLGGLQGELPIKYSFINDYGALVRGESSARVAP